MSHSTVASWRQAYQEALVEADPQKFQVRIALVEAMISLCLRALDHHPASSAERRAMKDALSHLRLFTLQEEAAGGQEWE